MRIDYDNGYYEGETKKRMQWNVPHGKGVFVAPTYKYEGDFVNGKWEGYGKYWSSKGSYYEGEFFYGRWDGEGTLTLKDGSTYKGHFDSGYLNGLFTVTDKRFNQEEVYFMFGEKVSKEDFEGIFGKRYGKPKKEKVSIFQKIINFFKKSE